MRKMGLLLALCFAVLAGCGVEWFPAYERLPTTPDSFSFTNQTGVALGAPVTSDSITVKGLTADSTPISISGDSSSKYSVNGATAVSTAGTVKNGDTVTVSHTASTEPATSTTSTLAIGSGNQAQQASFTSTTRNVEAFALTGVSNTPLSHVLKVASGVFTVTVTNSGTGTGAISFDGQVSYFSSATPTTFTFTPNMTIWLKGTSGAVAKITIDGVDSTFAVP